MKPSAGERAAQVLLALMKSLELIPFIMTVSVNILYHRRDFVSMGPTPLTNGAGWRIIEPEKRRALPETFAGSLAPS